MYFGVLFSRWFDIYDGICTVLSSKSEIYAAFSLIFRTTAKIQLIEILNKLCKYWNICRNVIYWLKITIFGSKYGQSALEQVRVPI